MPDINSIKAMAELFDISIDFLLDDGSTLDMSVTRESIDLSVYGYDRAGMAGKKNIKNRSLWRAAGWLSG